MSDNSIYALWMRGTVALWNGGASTRFAFVVWWLIVLLALLAIYWAGIAIVRTFRRARDAQTFFISGLGTARQIDVPIEYLASDDDALSKMRSGQQIAVQTAGPLRRIVRGKLKRREFLEINQINLSEAAFERLAKTPWIDGMERVPLKLYIRPGYSLWNHPDDSIRISMRVTVWVTLVNFIVAVAIGGFFWWLPH